LINFIIPVQLLIINMWLPRPTLDSGPEVYTLKATTDYKFTTQEESFTTF